MSQVPSWLSQNLVERLIGGVVILAVAGLYWIFMPREEHQADMELMRGAVVTQQAGIEQAIANLATQMERQAEQDKKNLLIDGLQDAIADVNGQILEKEAYVEEAPESSLNRARKRRIRELTAKRQELQAELAEAMRPE